MVSIVMPAHNEAGIIEASVREWHREVASRIAGSELILVNDGSTDETGKILETLAAELAGLRPVHLARNVGHGRAVRIGLDCATQPYVFQTDSDRQHLPADFWKVWSKRSEYDFVFGVRPQRADGAVRVVITNVMRLLNAVLWGIWIRDANCPFKLMRRDALAEVLARVPEDCFIPMVLVSIFARRMRYRVSEMTVNHLPRNGGTQSLKGLKRWFGVSLICARQLLSVRLSMARDAERCRSLPANPSR